MKYIILIFMLAFLLAMPLTSAALYYLQKTGTTRYFENNSVSGTQQTDSYVGSSSGSSNQWNWTKSPSYTINTNITTDIIRAKVFYNSTSDSGANAYISSAEVLDCGTSSTCASSSTICTLTGDTTSPGTCYNQPGTCNVSLSCPALASQYTMHAGDYLGFRITAYAKKVNITVRYNSTATNTFFNVTERPLVDETPPIITIVSPLAQNYTTTIIDFNVSLSENGSWCGYSLDGAANISMTRFNDTYFNYTKTGLSEGNYNLTFSCNDTNGNMNSTTLLYFAVDLSPPDITYVDANLSYSCGSIYTRVNCTVTDKMTSVNNVIIEAIKPSGRENFSASLLSGDTYYSDILVNEEGKWIFNCIANDSVGNAANLTSLEFNAYSSSAELAVYVQEILFSNINPVENEIVIVNATIHNLGCSNATNFSVAFYEGDPDNGGSQAGGNITLSVDSFSNSSVNISWNAKIGTSKIFAYADINNSVSESNKTDNKASREINVSAWQVFYGNASIGKILGNSYLSNMSFWTNETLLNGNVFITDKESRVGWLSLIALSRDINNNFVSDDFWDADSILNMTGFSDSVSNVFSSGGNPAATENFSIYRRDIKNVPVINSTNNLNFRTGILWDSSDDSDEEYSQADREDLVFVTKINKVKQGAYGVYDYELRVPAKLREYNDADKNELYFYYDLN